jgi:hypothetical protein
LASQPPGLPTGRLTQRAAGAAMRDGLDSRAVVLVASGLP